MHATGPAADVASRVLAITILSNIPLGLGFALSGVLRAAGDARRAMYVTLSGGIATFFTDPALIFGLGLGIYGAAWATVISRLIFLAVNVHIHFCRRDSASLHPRNLQSRTDVERRDRVFQKFWRHTGIYQGA